MKYIINKIKWGKYEKKHLMTGKNVSYNLKTYQLRHQMFCFESDYRFWKLKLKDAQMCLNNTKAAVTAIWKNKSTHDLKFLLQCKMYYLRDYYSACILEYNMAKALFYEASRIYSKRLDEDNKNIKI